MAAIITNQKDAVRKLAEAQEELKRAGRMKMEFLATLSHELSTSLNFILG